MQSLVRALALPLLLVCLSGSLVACDAVTRVTGPRSWVSTAELASGGKQVITVTDTTGKVTDAEIDPAGVKDTPTDSAVNVAGRPDQVLIGWVGGTCAETTDISLAAGQPGVAAVIKITPNSDGCDAMGVLHVLRLTFSGAMPANQVGVTTEY